MKQIDEVLKMWEEDSRIDGSEPGNALLNIPKLHSKYLNILSHHRLLLKDAMFKYNRMKKIKWEYYTGKLDDDELKKYGWKPFPYVLKTEIGTYMESDEDLNKYLAAKAVHEEMIDLCTGIIKELNSRTYQLRGYIDWQKFIQGI